MIVSESVVMKARQAGIHVKSYQQFYEDGPKSKIKKSLDTFMASGVRIVFVAAEGASRLALMTVAAQNGYINNDTVWITTDLDTDTLFAAVNDFNAILERRANNTDVIPKIYGQALLSENVTTTTTSSSNEDKNALKKQSLINLIDPVEYAARAATNLTRIDYNTTFSGGVFMFDVLKELPGYAPFDNFLDKWSRLDPAMYVVVVTILISSNLLFENNNH